MKDLLPTPDNPQGTWERLFQSFAFQSDCWKAPERPFISTATYVIWSIKAMKSVLLSSPLSDEVGSKICLRAMDLIPTTLYCPSVESKKHGISFVRKNLANDISEHLFLDNIRVQERGSSSNLVFLNKTSYAQPRRRSFSVIEHVRTKRQVFLYNITFRQLGVEMCSPMPKEIFQMGYHLWQASMPFLTKLSQQCPPNFCQVLFYYSAFGGKMMAHRDYPYGRKGGDGKIRGTNVLLYTSMMPMTLRFWECESDYLSGGRNKFKLNGIEVPLFEGTCFVFHPWDDERFLHDAIFQDKTKSALDAVSVRFVFRWLKGANPYHFGDSLVNNRQAV